MTIRSSLLLLTLILATTVLAQPQRMTPQERTDRLAKELALTDSQKVKVLDLFSKQDEARKKAFAEGSGDRDAMRATMQKMRDETNKQLKAILTPEQVAKYEKLRSQMPRGGMGRRPD
jgi:Spy/CpxP family protein refolding chaperone